MLSPVRNDVTFRMACGHDEVLKTTYHSKSELSRIRAENRKQICMGCVDIVAQWLNAAGTPGEPFPLKLSPLQGTPAQVAWAAQIRDKQWAHISPVLYILLTDGSELARALWKSIVIRFMIAQSSYWIEQNNATPNQFSLATAIGEVLKPSMDFERARGDSDFKRLKKMAPQVLKNIMTCDPVSLYSNFKAAQSAPT